jgi:hypothetical protein
VETTYTVTVPPTPVTVSEGGSVEINVTIPSVGGTFDNPVSMSASGLPRGATATFNPSVVTPGSAGALTVLTIQLAAVAAGTAGPLRMVLFTSFILAIGLCSMNLNRKRFFGNFKRALAFPVLACVAYTLVGCGSASLVTTTIPPNSFVLTITGTSGSTHASTTVTVVVQ